MGKIKNNSEVKTYDDSKPEKVTVNSHWNQRSFVEILIGKQKVVVDGNDLKTAIDNCMNVGL